MAFKQGHALLIGVGSYKFAQAKNAPQTVEDAEELAGVLTNSRHAGYPESQVVILTDQEATHNNVLRALDQLAQSTNKNDTVFLFYAGHGDYDKDRAYYLTTHDTQWVDGAVVFGTAIREDELLKKLAQLQAERVFLLFNSCHSGTLSPSRLDVLGEDVAVISGEPVPNETTTAILATGKGRVVITACRENQRSYFDKNALLTFFADAISSGLQGKGIVSRRGYISVFDLYTKIYDDVTKVVARRSNQKYVQEPELTILEGVGAMAIALHRGKEGVGQLGDEDMPEVLPEGVRKKDRTESQAAMDHLLGGNFQHTIVAAREMNQFGGDHFVGDSVRAGRDVVNTGGGDFVGRDKINVGNITNSTGVVIGSGSKSYVNQDKGRRDIEDIFQELYKQIEKLESDPAIIEEVREKIEIIKKEANNTKQANEAKIQSAFTVLKRLAPDIMDVVVAALVNPVAGMSTVVKKVAERMRSESGSIQAHSEG